MVRRVSVWAVVLVLLATTFTAGATPAFGSEQPGTDRAAEARRVRLPPPGHAGFALRTAVCARQTGGSQAGALRLRGRVTTDVYNLRSVQGRYHQDVRIRFQRWTENRWRLVRSASRRFRKGNFTYEQLSDRRTSGFAQTINDRFGQHTFRMQVIVRLYRNRENRPDLLQWRYERRSPSFFCTEDGDVGIINNPIPITPTV